MKQRDEKSGGTLGWMKIKDLLLNEENKTITCAFLLHT